MSRPLLKPACSAVSRPYIFCSSNIIKICWSSFLWHMCGNSTIVLKFESWVQNILKLHPKVQTVKDSLSQKARPDIKSKMIHLYSINFNLVEVHIVFALIHRANGLWNKVMHSKVNISVFMQCVFFVVWTV